MQGVYEPHHDIHMQPYPEGAAGQAYNDQGYSSSSLPAQQTSSTDRMHPGYPAAGEHAQHMACQYSWCCCTTYVLPLTLCCISH